MYRKRVSLAAGLCCCVSMLVWAQFLEAGAGSGGKVTICHKADSVKYFQISVASRAVPAHLAHGDCLVDDDALCTVDRCDTDLGCVHAPDDAACDDGNACTSDICDPATGCVYSPITCDDGDACTSDSCDSATGCVNSPITCDDGNACTSDSCDAAGGCVYTDNIVCGDGVECAPEQCESDADCSAGSFCDACTCTPEPNPECDGATCKTFIPCNPGSGCLVPVCATTDAGGVCLEGGTPCEGLLDCTTSADCPGGGLCAVGTCCGRNICVDPSIFCLSDSTAAAPVARVKTNGRTIARGAE